MTDNHAAEMLERRRAALARKIHNRVADLRALADTLARIADHDLAAIGTGQVNPMFDNYVTVAVGAQKAVADATYNLLMHNLAQDAYDLDVLRRLADD